MGFRVLNLVKMIFLQWRNTESANTLAFILDWIELSSHFLDNSKHSKFCFRKKQFLAISRQFSSVNFENPCKTKIKQIWKGKHFNYSRVRDELKIKTYFQRQSRAKYIGNLLGSTENLDSKRTFSFAFCLFSTR